MILIQSEEGDLGWLKEEMLNVGSWEIKCKKIQFLFLMKLAALTFSVWNPLLTAPSLGCYEPIMTVIRSI